MAEFAGRRLPESGAEWQVAVDAAAHFLWLESARAYGLVEGGPAVDIERCEEILRLGAGLGFVPGELRIEELVAAVGLRPSGPDGHRP